MVGTPTIDTSPILNQVKLTHELKQGNIGAEEYILRQLGYDVQPYAGKIPIADFSVKVNKAGGFDENQIGSHHQIYVEPNVPVCYKTRIADVSTPVDPNRIEFPLRNNLPGYLQEGIFLEKIQKYQLPGIPQFLGFVRLPDDRISVAQQFISNSIKIPVENSFHNGRNGLYGTSSEIIYSIFTALEEVASTVDQIYQLGGTINDSEISGNLRMEMDDDKVKRIWIVDFEEGYTIPDKPSLTKRQYPPELSITIFSLLSEAIRSRPENTNATIDHQVIDYMKFVLWNKPNIDGWTMPTTSLEVIKQVNQILHEHPLEEFRHTRHSSPSNLDYQLTGELGGLDD